MHRPCDAPTFKTRCLALGLLLTLAAPLAQADVCHSNLNVFGETASADAGQSAFVDLLANDSHDCGAPLRVASVTDNCPGTVVNHDDGSLTYRPAASDESCQIFYDVVSEDGASDSATVTMTVGNGSGGSSPVVVPDDVFDPTCQSGNNGVVVQCCWREITRAIDVRYRQGDATSAPPAGSIEAVEPWADPTPSQLFNANSENWDLLCTTAKYLWLQDSDPRKAATVSSLEGLLDAQVGFDGTSQFGWMSREIFSPVYQAWIAGAWLAVYNHARLLGDDPNLEAKAQDWLRTYWTFNSLTATPQPIDLAESRLRDLDWSVPWTAARPQTWSGLTLGNAGARGGKGQCVDEDDDGDAQCVDANGDGIGDGPDVPIRTLFGQAQSGMQLTALALNDFPRDFTATGIWGASEFHYALWVATVFAGSDWSSADGGSVDLPTVPAPPEAFGLTLAEQNDLRNFLDSDGSDPELFTALVDTIASQGRRPRCQMSFLRTHAGTATWFGLGESSEGACGFGTQQTGYPIYAVTVRPDASGDIVAQYLTPQSIGAVNPNSDDHSFRRGNQICYSDSPLTSTERCIDIPLLDPGCPLDGSAAGCEDQRVFHLEWSRASGLQILKAPTLPPPVDQTPWVGDHFELDGGRVAGDPLDGTTSDLGDRTWQGNVEALFGGDASAGWVTHPTATSTIQAAAGVAFDPDLMPTLPDVLTVGADVRVTSGGGWAAIGWGQTPADSFWVDGVWVLLQSTGHWTIYDAGHAGGALAQSTMPTDGYLPAADNALKLQYDRLAGTLSAWVNDVPLVLSLPLQASSAPDVRFAGFRIFAQDGGAEGRIRTDDFWVHAGTALGEQDDAEIIVQEFPAAIACGQTDTARVTVRNPGNTAWYSLPTGHDGYAWQIPENDPFAPAGAQALLADGETIFPQETRTFEWTLTAPATPSPAGGYLTEGQMTRQISGVFGESASAHIIVSCDNLPPIPDDETFGVLVPPGTLQIHEQTLLNGDIDPDGDDALLQITGFDTSGMAGALTPVSVGVWQYAAPADPTIVVDSFRYEVTDEGGLPAWGNVTLQIFRNQPPIAQPDDLETPVNVPLTFTSAELTANDSDPDPGDEVVFPLQELTVDLGQIVRTSSTPPYEYVFTPPVDFAGTASFTYVLQDSQGAVADPPGQVTIHVVQSAPIATDDRFLVPFGESLRIPTSELVANDVDANGDPLWVSGHGEAAFGSLVDTRGEITFLPDATFWSAGADAFLYDVTDGQLTDQGVAHLLAEPACDTYLGDDFESGDLAAWSGPVPAGGNATVEAAAAAEGSFGLRMTLAAGDARLYIEDGSPIDERHFRSRWLFNPNAFAMQAGDEHALFVGLVPGSNAFGVRLTTDGNGPQLRLAVSRDSGSQIFSNPVHVADDAWHRVFVDWWAASAPGANDGGARLWVDGLLIAEILGVDNDQRVVDRVRLGAPAGLDAGSSGSYFFDAYASCDGPTSWSHQDDFETGDLQNWDSTIASGGGSLAVTSSAAIGGSLGLAVTVVEGAGQVHVRENPDPTRNSLTVTFDFDPNSIAMADGSAHPILHAGAASGGALSITLGREAGSYRLRSQAITDSGQTIVSNWTTLTDAAHALRLEFQKATAPGATDGSLKLWVNGFQTGNLTGLDNASKSLDALRLGAIWQLDPGTVGTLYFDDVQAW